MKNAKRIITIILTIALVVGGLYFAPSKETSANVDFSITSPKDGSLKAAGYMDIEWEDASHIGAVKNYEVYIDGSLKTTTTSRKYEFYTTKVNYHKAWIKANFKDGSGFYSKTVRFGVSKKGMATESGMAYYRLDPQAMGVSWYYNWGRGAYTGKYAGIPAGAVLRGAGRKRDRGGHSENQADFERKLHPRR